MRIEQIYTNCLAQGAYYIESDGEVAIIDPLRDIQPYIDRATKSLSRIKYVLETHFHADFVSGHLDIAKATGATIVYGPTAKPSFEALIASDGMELPLGKVRIRVLHTPGHTMESCCYLLMDENGKEVALFSGDTLFLGDVGRPDLAQKATGMTAEDLAGLLYTSLRTKIMPLNDDIVVYPAHGAGSACGKNMSNETQDTLGHQKKTNYALRADMTREEFIKEVLTGLATPPQYFPTNVLMNKTGYDNIADVLKKGMKAWPIESFEAIHKNTGALILDTRRPEQFVKGFLPGAMNISLDGNFAPWAGALIDSLFKTILVVADNGREEEAIKRLARVGFNNCVGYLGCTMEDVEMAGWKLNSIDSISVEALAEQLANNPNAVLLDVRKESEYNSMHVAGAESLPLDNINREDYQLDKDLTYYVHCASGYRSVIFISMMMRKGYTNLVNVPAGFKGIQASGLFNTTEYSTPLTML